MLCVSVCYKYRLARVNACGYKKEDCGLQTCLQIHVTFIFCRVLARLNSKRLIDHVDKHIVGIIFFTLNFNADSS